MKKFIIAVTYLISADFSSATDNDVYKKWLNLQESRREHNVVFEQINTARKQIREYNAQLEALIDDIKNEIRQINAPKSNQYIDEISEDFFLEPKSFIEFLENPVKSCISSMKIKFLYVMSINLYIRGFIYKCFNRESEKLKKYSEKFFFMFNDNPETQLTLLTMFDFLQDDLKNKNLEFDKTCKGTLFDTLSQRKKKFYICYALSDDHNSQDEEPISTNPNDINFDLYKFTQNNPQAKKLLTEMQAAFKSETEKAFDELQNKLQPFLNMMSPEIRLRFELFKLSCLNMKLPNIYGCSPRMPVKSFPPEFLDSQKSLKEKIFAFIPILLNNLIQKETFPTLVEKAENIEQTIRDQKKTVLKHISKEIYDSSRKATPREKDNLTPLMSIVAPKQNIQEIRFLDAKSLINTTHLPQEEKNRLINLAEHGSIQEIYREILKLIDTLYFDEDSYRTTFRQFNEKQTYRNRSLFMLAASDPMYYSPKFPELRESLKEVITSYFCRGVLDSPVYKDLIITFIAHAKDSTLHLYDAEAKNNYFLPTPVIAPNRKLGFAVHNGSNAVHSQGFSEIIHLNFFEKSFSYWPFLSPSISEKPQLVFKSSDPYEALFHEIGHTITRNIARALYDNQMTEASLLPFAVFSNGLSIIRNKDIIEQNNQKIDSLTEDKYNLIGKNIDDFFDNMGTESILSGHLMPYAETDNFLKVFQESDEMFNCVNIFQGPWELLQILGITACPHEDKNILYINLLSDLAASLSEKQLMRMYHISYIYAARDQAEKTEISPIIEDIFLKSNYIKEKKINGDFYKALLAVFNISPEKYAEFKIKDELYDINQIILNQNMYSKKTDTENIEE